MKVIRLLDQQETKVVSDLLIQMMLRELVASERSVTGLARTLDSPVLKVWRRVQRLESMGLIEVVRTQKSGNIETKVYRASATRFIPAQFLEFKPKDPRLLEALAIFSEFQKAYNGLIARSNEIPQGWDPIDYSFYSSMQAFAQVYGDPQAREKVSKLRQWLSEFKDSPLAPPVKT